MKKFLFVSHLVRGRYQYVTDEGDEVNYDGISLYLGIGKGNTVEEAWADILDSGYIGRTLPEVRIRHAFGYEIVDDGVQVKYQEGKEVHTETEAPKPLRSPSEKYETKVCVWCHEPVPSNGAALFSHIKRHLRSLVKGDIITKQQMDAIHSINLPAEINLILDQHKKLL
jgi:hypothetical protein